MITFNNNFPKARIRLLASTDKVIRSQADEGNICWTNNNFIRQLFYCF